MSRKIDVAALTPVIGTMYPPPYDEPCLAKSRTKLGDAAGLTQFGVNLLRLPPGAWSSQRHWQTASDEFVYVLAGEVTLVTNSGAELLRPGDCAGFKAGTQMVIVCRTTHPTMPSATTTFHVVSWER